VRFLASGSPSFPGELSLPFLRRAEKARKQFGKEEAGGEREVIRRRGG